jgi:hypothetical protein
MMDATFFNTQANREQFRKAICNVARAEIGTVEKPGNDTKYGRWARMNGVSWCAIFASWVYNEASVRLGVPDPLTGLQTRFGYAHVTTAFVMAQRRGWVVEDPMPGDLVMWDHDDIPFGPGHTGVIVSVDGGILVAVEGNTSRSDHSSRNGGEVCLHQHTIAPRMSHGRLLGFVRPTRRFYKP